MTTINLATFRNSGESDNDAFNRAMQDASPSLEIYFPAGQGQTSGAYRLSTPIWASFPTTPAAGNITRSNVTLYGDGMYQSVIEQPEGENPIFEVYVDPSNPSAVRTNLVFRDLLLDGSFYRNQGSYNEQNHTVRLAGVNTATFERVFFRNFEGDGLFLGSPNTSLIPRNSNLVVDSCRFENIGSRRGRNAISILDCATWRVAGSAFVNVGDGARPNPGPGAIDVEPENANAIVTNGTVYNCSFDAPGTNAIALLNDIRANASGVSVTYCSVRNAGRGLAETSNFTGASFNDNYCENLNEIAFVRSSTTIEFLRNSIRGGQSFRMQEMQSLRIEANALVECGKGDGVVFRQLGSIRQATVSNNQLYDCGIGGFSPMYFVVQPYVTILDLSVKGNVLNTMSAPLRISDIATVTGAWPSPQLENTSTATYNNVDRRGNSPSQVPGGTERLFNRP